MKQIHFFAVSERGISPTNDDAYYTGKIGRFHVFGVAGGRTGKPAGKEAGEIALDCLRQAVKSLPGDPAGALERAVADADARIGALGRKDREHEGAGTSLCACLVDENMDCTILDTGNGGVYYISRGSGIVIPREIPFSAKTTAPEKKTIVSHTLGEPYVLRGDELNRVNLADSFVLLSSSGLYDYVKKCDIGDIVKRNGENVETSCEELKDRALQDGSERTITVILLHGHPG